MADAHELIEAIGRNVTQYRQGIFCPDEMWLQVADRLTTRNVATILDGLPVELQDVLRRAYAERSWSLRSDARDHEVCLEVERWCARCDP
jgi:hypothetical protein